MHFTLSDEQRLMQDSLVRLMDRHYGFEQRKAYQGTADGFSRELWRQYAELGLLALPFDESHGGLGGTAIETMIVMEQFGRVLALEPYLATVILAGGALRHAGSEAQKALLVPGVAEGRTMLALAHEERAARYDLAHVETTARPDGDGFVIDGRKDLVLHGGAADMLVVSARLTGTANDTNGLGLFLVESGSPGVTVARYPTQDGQQAADIAFAGVRVAPEDAVGTPGEALAVIERVYHEAIAALCAEAVGAMGALHANTVDYLKQRRQFGVPIGSFQALQHRAAEMFMALEQARSMAMFAAIRAGDTDAARRRQAVSAAKVQIGRSGRFIGEQAVQLHGGIAIAAEFSAGHYFKRLTTIDRLMGDADHHLAQVARGDSLIEQE